MTTRFNQELPTVEYLWSVLDKNYNMFGSIMNNITHYQGDDVGYRLYSGVFLGCKTERDYSEDLALSNFPARPINFEAFKHFYGRRELTKG